MRLQIQMRKQYKQNLKDIQNTKKLPEKKIQITFPKVLSINFA